MDLFTIHYVKTNPMIYQYLRDDSSWYKLLNRDRNNLKYLEEEMKKKYKLTVEDRIEKFSHSINMISAFMDVLK